MPRVTPIRTPERASDHLARVHRHGGETPPVTAWFGAGAAAKGLSGPGNNAHLEARRLSRATASITQRERASRQAGFDLEAFVARVCQRTTPLSAPSSTLRMEGM
jgi:hypothetical protein